MVCEAEPVTIIPDFDYGAMLAAEPTIWRERGLHYHAYSWRGDGKAMQENEVARADVGSELPPQPIRVWLRKPQRLLRAAPLTPEEAMAWLRAEYEPLAAQLAGDVGEFLPVAERMRLKIYDLRCGNDTVIEEWLRGGVLVHLAVISVSGRECSQHGAGS